MIMHHLLIFGEMGSRPVQIKMDQAYIFCRFTFPSFAVYWGSVENFSVKGSGTVCITIILCVDIGFCNENLL